MYRQAKRFAYAGLLLSMTLCLVGTGMAQEASKGNIIYNSSPDVPILQFEERIEELAIEQHKSVTVYGNGRVHVHYPAVMKKAGDYEYYLSEAEVSALLESLMADGLFSFNKGKTKQAQQASERARAQRARSGQGELVYRSDETVSYYKFNLDSYTSPGANGATLNGHQKEFTYRGVKHAAQNNPGVDALQDLASADSRLSAMMDDSRMSRVNTQQGGN